MPLNARVRDDGVEPAEPIDGSGDRHFDIAFPCHIGFKRQRLPALFANFRCDRLDAGRRNPRERDRRAPRGHI